VTVDPKRLVDGTRPGLARMLRQAQDDGLDERAVERVKLGLATALAASAGGTAAGVGHASAGGKLLGGWAVKALLGSVLVAGSVGGVVALGVLPGSTRSPGAPVAALPQGSPLVVPSSTGVAGPEPPTPSPPVHPRPLGDTSRPPSSSGDTPRPPSSLGDTPGPAAHDPSGTPRRTSLQPASRDDLGAPAPPPTVVASGADAPTVAAPVDEGRLLLEARRALPTDPAHALELVHAHASRFPVSQLSPERVRIEAEARKRLAGSGTP
jgi:hypothetical protein